VFTGPILLFVFFFFVYPSSLGYLILTPLETRVGLRFMLSLNRFELARLQFLMENFVVQRVIITLIYGIILKEINIKKIKLVNGPFSWAF
jgi:hypothetical protein